jgi:hypothetical protein
VSVARYSEPPRQAMMTQPTTPAQLNRSLEQARLV